VVVAVAEEPGHWAWTVKVPGFAAMVGYPCRVGRSAEGSSGTEPPTNAAELALGIVAKQLLRRLRGGYVLCYARRHGVLGPPL
jgi:hypothetical protein